MQRETVSFQNICKIYSMSDDNKCSGGGGAGNKTRKGDRSGGGDDTFKEIEEKASLIR